MDTRNSHSRIAWWRALFVLAACLGLAFDGAAPHDVAVDRVGAVSGIEIAESAIHPGDPAHLESAEMEVHPGCGACLLQIETRTLPGPLPNPLPPVTRDFNAAVLVETVSSYDISLPGPSRAPPVSIPTA